MNDHEFLNDRDCTPKGETPRTNAVTRTQYGLIGKSEVVDADFARELEQKLRECRNSFAALRFAVVGATACDAVAEAHRLRAENDRLHMAQFDLARALRVVEAAKAYTVHDSHDDVRLLNEMMDAIEEWEAGR